MPKMMKAPEVDEITHKAKVYLDYEKENHARLDEISLLLAEHCGEDFPNIHYGHIGDMTHVAELLDEVISFLSGKGGE